MFSDGVLLIWKIFEKQHYPYPLRESLNYLFLQFLSLGKVFFLVKSTLPKISKITRSVFRLRT